MEQIIDFIINNNEDLKRVAEAQTLRLSKGAAYFSGAAKAEYINHLRETRIMIVTNILKKQFPFQQVQEVIDSPTGVAIMNKLWEEHAKD